VAPSSYAVTPPPLSLRQEFVRKALHLAAAVFPVAYALGAPRAAIAIALAVTSAIALLLEWLRRTNQTVRAMFDRFFGAIVRPHERRSITGATWLSLACLVAVLVFARNAAIAALWCATVGDPAASLFGKLVSGKSAATVENAGKTLPGSLACLTVSFGGAWMVAGYSPLSAAMIAAAATIVEAWPVQLDDNVRVAAAAGAIAQLLA
jgi:dolichol kinase